MKNDLVKLKGNDAFTDSMIVADGTGVTHKKIKLAITKNQKYLEKFGGISVQYQTENNAGRGRPETFYLLNEQQATFLITLLKNTETVVEFKAELVRQFYEMRRFILQRQTEDWKETRKTGKLTRKTETDTLKRLVEYASAQGSSNPNRLYTVYSTLANKVAGITDREAATVSQLNTLSLAENIILHCIEAGIAEGKHYKEIYLDSKARLEMFKDIAFLGTEEREVTEDAADATDQ